MRFKFTVILLVLNLFILGLIIYLNKLADRSSATGVGLAAQIGRELTQANRIELRGRGIDAPRIIKRDGSDWVVTEPMRWNANYFAINRILNQLQFLEEEASFSVAEMEQTGQRLSDYGLEDPVLELTVAEGSRALSIKIGTLTELGNSLYLLGPDEDRIFVVNRKVIDGLLVDLNDLRTREIFDIPVFEVDALSLQIRSETGADDSFLKVRLARNNGDWTFEAPVSAAADPDLVDNTINTLTAAKVRRFSENADSDLAEFGLDESFMEVTIHGNNRRQTLIIGDSDPEAEGSAHYFAKLEENPAVFTILARPFDALREAQEALRQRDFMRFDEKLLSAINIRGEQRTIRLQKLETDGWQVLESASDDEIQPRRADPQIIQALIRNLAELRASDFAADNPSSGDEAWFGFDEPRRSVELSFTEGQSLRLQLAHPEGDNESLYAKTSTADFIYAVERTATLASLPLNTLHYRNRTLSALPEAARIQKLTLTNRSTKTEIINLQLEADVEDWSDRLSELETDQANLIQSLLDSIRKFEVKRYLFDSYAEAYPVDADRTLPWTFRLSASVVLPGGETDRVEELNYDFTERLPGSVQVGGSEARNSIFEIPQALIETLHQLTENSDTAAGAPEETKSELIDPLEKPDPIESDRND